MGIMSRRRQAQEKKKQQAKKPEAPVSQKEAALIKKIQKKGEAKNGADGSGKS